MHSHSEIRHVPYSPRQMFDLVVDIERYPEFIPWCRAARITAHEKDHFIGELIVSFSHMTERYSSKVTPVAPANGEGTIEVELVSGPFSHLDNHWRFVPKDGGTDIHFAVEFTFKSKILNTLIGGFFGKAVDKMGAAFVTRADALYGKNA